MNWSGCSNQGVATLDCLPLVIANLISWAIVLAGAVSVILIIFGGIKFITSGGDPKGVEAARKTVMFAVIGLIVIFASFAIVKLIAETTGVGCIDPSHSLSLQ